MNDLAPGDWVECITIESNPLPTSKPAGFCIGGIYQISGFSPKGGLFFVKMPTPKDCNCETYPGCGWARSAFRPIYRPKETLIEALKEPIEDLVESLI